jgi:hypothetical protein
MAADKKRFMNYIEKQRSIIFKIKLKTVLFTHKLSSDAFALKSIGIKLFKGTLLSKPKIVLVI